MSTSSSCRRGTHRYLPSIRADVSIRHWSTLLVDIVVLPAWRASMPRVAITLCFQGTPIHSPYLAGVARIDAPRGNHTMFPSTTHPLSLSKSPSSMRARIDVPRGNHTMFPRNTHTLSLSKSPSSMRARIDIATASWQLPLVRRLTAAMRHCTFASTPQQYV